MSGTPLVTVGIPTRNRPEWLREAMRSVLAQRFENFTLLVADNASTEETRTVVESFGDDRIVYDRSPTDVGMSRNHNRIVAATTTPYLAILPDDDLLYPDFLEASLRLLEPDPRVGVVHCAFDLIDRDGKLIRPGVRVGPHRGAVTRESGPELIERGMRHSGLVCATSALMRTEAIAGAQGVRPSDEPYADGPLMMRIGLKYDFVAQDTPLVAVRVHADAASATAGDFTGTGYAFDDSIVHHLDEQRRTFLDEADLPAAEKRRYRAIAARAYRGDRIGLITRDILAGGERRRNLGRLLGLARSEPQAVISPAAAKLAFALVGGGPATDALGRLKTRVARAGRLR